MSFYNEYGLINAEETEQLAENTLLFSAEYLFLCEQLKRNKGLQYKLLKTNIRKYINLCRKGNGLYNQHPIPMEGKEAYMSHDQLTTIVCYSYFYKLSYHKAIWKLVCDQGFRYNNVTPDEPGDRYLHPRDILFYGYCAGSWICYLLYPLLFLIMLVSCLSNHKHRFYAEVKEKRTSISSYEADYLFYTGQGHLVEPKEFNVTDGKLLTWLRCRTCNLRITHWLLNNVLKMKSLFKSFINCFRIYFKDPKHPIRQLIR